MADQPQCRLRRFSHVLFDLDETLATYALKTSDVVSVVWNRLAISVADLGFPGDAAMRYDAVWIALERSARSADELRLAVWKSVLAERGQASSALAQRIAAEHGAVRRSTGARLLNGVAGFLSSLRSAGYGLGLLTNGLSDVQWEKVHSLGLELLVDAVRVTGDTGIYKPDLHAFLGLIEVLGATAGRCLFVGDSYEADVIGAAGSGMATAWVRPAGTPIPGIVTPEFVVERATDLRSVLL